MGMPDSPLTRLHGLATRCLQALWQDWRSSLYVAPDKGANPGVKWFHPTEADVQAKLAKKAA